MATSTQVAPASQPISNFDKALIFGDVTGLSERERLEYLKEMAGSVGLNPISRPFGYLPAGGKLTVYLTATGAAQLRSLHHVSVTEIVDEGLVSGFYRVKVYGKMPSGRVDVEYGSVNVMKNDGSLIGPQELENARKKCVTQAKTRLTKSMVGLAGVLAEEEIEDIGGAVPQVQIPQRAANGADLETGEMPNKPTTSEPPTHAQNDAIDKLRTIHLAWFGMPPGTGQAPAPRRTPSCTSPSCARC